ncbi:MAG: DNA polymerase III subunit gamma/tau [Proteobacteria bacterium]|nr:DNA polymerase III subunit gamma/tau [Pseudomonadota bacterium]
MTSLFPTDSDANATAQPYRVLARKYRPSTFAELIGQEAMVKTLTHAIQTGRLPQAWMLTGVRGIGKTTTARIIAKALNCTGRDPASQTIEPCGACDACRAITEDRHVDIQEMDAASRTGVDDIREIVEGVRYGPVSAKYKIYILDEVHMLSKNAFNALLKTLEEPPAHTKFIFATTEIRKVPVTVLSRCQRFDLRRIQSSELTTHFLNIVKKEGAEAEESAIKLIAQAADGSVRDGLSLLDQAIALGNGRVSEADVKEMLGLADRGASLMLCAHVLRGEMPEVLVAYDGMLQSGCDPLQVLQDMAASIHLLTRAKIITETAFFEDMPEAERSFVREMEAVSIPALARAWQILIKGISEVQIAAQPAIAAEMVLIRLGFAAQMPTPGELIKQLKEEGAVGQGAVVSSTSSGTGATGPTAGGGGNVRAIRAGAVRFASVEAVAQPMEAPVATTQTKTQDVALAVPADFRALVELFAQNREGGLYGELSSAVHLVHFLPGKLEVRLEKDASTTLISRMTACLQKWTGQRWMVAVVDQEGEPTLVEQNRLKERARQEKAESHPLMKDVLVQFPTAKIVSLKAKDVAPLPLLAEEADVVEEFVPDIEEED